MKSTDQLRVPQLTLYLFLENWKIFDRVCRDRDVRIAQLVKAQHSGENCTVIQRSPVQIPARSEKFAQKLAKIRK